MVLEVSNAATVKRPGVLVNAAGDEVPTETDPAGIVRAAAPNGRLVVAAGQTIASAWGNTTYDQTMQTFASAADRTNQWPAPNDGALSWLVDTRTPWVFRAGAWRGIPLGYLATATGPASQVDCGTALVTIVSLSFPVVLGRRYRLTALINGNTITAAGAPTAKFSDDQAAGQNMMSANSTPAGTNVNVWGSYFFTPNSTRTAVVTLQAAQGGAGALRCTPPYSQMFAEDIGS